jgi:3-oxoacyl-[acyl-carrier protein] reductase
MQLNLEGKAFVVTGGARGIGKAISLALGECKAQVALTYTGSSPESIKRAEDLCHKIESLGAKAIALQLDVSVSEQVDAAVEATLKTFGRLDGLVNNAGITADGLIMRYKTSDWDRVIDTNLRGAFLMSKAVIRPLMKAGGGSIVNMGSVVGQMGNAGQCAYAASKAGLEGLTKSLAREVGSRKIRVNVVAPGYIVTDMTHGLTEDQKKALLANVALESLGEPEDIASATLFLLSSLSRYVTGQVLSVNGGLYM